MASIVFIHNLSKEDQDAWLSLFKTLLPNETIVLPESLTDEQAQHIDLAIVANPDVKVLTRFTNLVWVQSLWAGVEAIVESFRAFNDTPNGNKNKKIQGVKLVRLIDPQLAHTMAEAVLAWTLYLHRNIPEYAAQQRQKIWQQISCPTAHNVRVSVLGAGELGICAMQTLVQQSYQVNSWSRTAKNINKVTHFFGEEGLINLLENTDILVCLLPLTKQTRGLLNARLFRCLPKGAKFINFARGGIANYSDLVTVLDEGHLSHAVLDVFEQEPLKTSSSLWEHPKVSVLPHISAMTNRETASQVIANNIVRFRQDGSIPQSVDLERGY